MVCERIDVRFLYFIVFNLYIVYICILFFFVSTSVNTSRIGHRNVLRGGPFGAEKNT